MNQLPPIPSSKDYVPPQPTPWKEFLATAALFLLCWTTLLGLVLAVCAGLP